MKKKILFIIITGVLLVAVLWLFPGIGPRGSAINPELYRIFCEAVIEKAEVDTKWHIAIYLDVNACLTCNEDMDAWREMQEKLPGCNAVLSLWAPREDSLDVALAMELEGMKAPVNVLESEALAALGWSGKQTPIKVLLDNQCQPVKIINCSGNSRTARLAIEKLLSELSS
ncbi:MAG: hypothetical protein JXA92_08910 [candidate division Zixibacteria bacterium]|nr:hypothetical protein [candidate division Zixibacteria bacterium]